MNNYCVVNHPSNTISYAEGVPTRPVHVGRRHASDTVRGTVLIGKEEKGCAIGRRWSSFWFVHVYVRKLKRKVKKSCGTQAHNPHTCNLTSPPHLPLMASTPSHGALWLSLPFASIPASSSLLLPPCNKHRSQVANGTIHGSPTFTPLAPSTFSGNNRTSHHKVHKLGGNKWDPDTSPTYL